MYANITVIVVNLALNVVLIPRYGIVGAAVATAAGYTVMNGIYLVALYFEAGIHPFRTALVRPASVAISLWGVYYVWLRPRNPTLPLVGLSIMGFTVGYIVAILRFGGVEKEDVLILETAEDYLGRDLLLLRKIGALIA